MGGGSGGSQSGSTTATIPDELKPLVSGAVGWETGLQQNLPISQFTGSHPQQIAGLSPMQSFGLQQIPGLAQTDPAAAAAFQTAATIPELTSASIPTPPAEFSQINQLWDLTSGPIGSSPATQAGMEAWKSGVLPTVENEMINAGLGRSGDLLQAVAASGSGAFFPLIQQEVANRESSIGQLGQLAATEQQRFLQPRQDTVAALMGLVPNLTNLSSTMFGQRQAAADEALKAGQTTRDITQQQLDAAYQDFLRLQGLSTSAVFGPTGQVLPGMIGNTSNASKTMGVGQWLGK